MEGQGFEGPATPVEAMIVTAARLIPDEAVLMVGTQWPILASLLAKSLHAPRATICFEGGVILGKLPDRIPLFTGDPVSNACSVLLGESLDTLGMILHAGRANMALLSAASVDRYGNINSTAIGKYKKPKVRLVGSGGGEAYGKFDLFLQRTDQVMARLVEGLLEWLNIPGFDPPGTNCG